jgi:hypothetical protein
MNSLIERVYLENALQTYNSGLIGLASNHRKECALVARHFYYYIYIKLAVLQILI